MVQRKFSRYSLFNLKFGVLQIKFNIFKNKFKLLQIKFCLLQTKLSLFKIEFNYQKYYQLESLIQYNLSQSHKQLVIFTNQIRPLRNQIQSFQIKFINLSESVTNSNHRSMKCKLSFSSTLWISVIFTNQIQPLWNQI